MMGAIAYLVLFVRCARRTLYRNAVCLEACLMEAILQQFFGHRDHGARGPPLIFRGLGMTLLVCAAVVPLGPSPEGSWWRSRPGPQRAAFASSWRSSSTSFARRRHSCC